MRTVNLGKSRLEATPITLGTWELSGHWGPVDEAAGIAAIRRAIERGITTFDTAHAYGFGQAERILGTALQVELRDRRASVVVATKGGLRLDDIGIPYPDSDPAWLREGLETSLRSLNADYVDLYQVHAPDPSRPFEETAEVLAQMVADEKVLHVGVSNFDVAQIEAFRAVLEVETLQVEYSCLERGPEDALLPYTAANDIGVLAYAPLAHGVLTDALGPQPSYVDGDWRKFSPSFNGEGYQERYRRAQSLEALARERWSVPLSQLALAWVLHQPGVHTAIVGTSNPQHVDTAVDAASIKLDASDLRAVGAILGQPPS